MGHILVDLKEHFTPKWSPLTFYNGNKNYYGQVKEDHFGWNTPLNESDQIPFIVFLHYIVNTVMVRQKINKFTYTFSRFITNTEQI